MDKLHDDDTTHIIKLVGLTGPTSLDTIISGVIPFQYVITELSIFANIGISGGSSVRIGISKGGDAAIADDPTWRDIFSPLSTSEHEGFASTVFTLRPDLPIRQQNTVIKFEFNNATGSTFAYVIIITIKKLND